MADLRDERERQEDGPDDGDGVGDEDRHAERRRRARQGYAEAIPLENLLRLLAGQRVVVERREAASNNEELVAGLKRSGILSSDAVARAMLAVPRGSFVPEDHRGEAWVDSPIRVDALDFNISAPHMHAQLLESLEISPGDRVLDVGCGCGFIAACAALLVGTTGTVVGVDTKPACVRMSRDNVARLAGANSEFAAAAAPVTFLQHNIFIPSPALTGGFNKVCIGAACPEDRLHLLLHLLDPAGGKLLAPVDNDLRLYTRDAGGALRQRLVSSVRFSDLEVPSDATIALSVLQQERAAAQRVVVSPSTLEQDLPRSLGKGCAGGLMQMCLPGCFHSFGGQSPPSGSGSDTLPQPATPAMRNHKAAEAPAGEQEAPVADAAPDLQLGPLQPWQQQVAEGCDLGEPDCQLVGHGWRLPAHKQVLKRRSAHFRAQLSSGMRDAHDSLHQVPEGFGLQCMQALLLFLYRDELPPGLEPSGAVELLHAAAYYGTPRLIELCEAQLVEELLRLPAAAGAAEAPHLLCLADELGLEQLQRATVAFISQHYAEAQASEAFKSLDKRQVELVASHLVGEMGRLQKLLRDLEPPTGAAALPKRRAWW